TCADEVALQSYEDALRAEHRAPPLRAAAGRGRPVAPQHARQQPVPAPRKHDEPRMPGFERGEVEPRVAPVCTAEMRLCNQPAEIRVAFGRLGEQRHVRTVE